MSTLLKETKVSPVLIDLFVYAASKGFLRDIDQIYDHYIALLEALSTSIRCKVVSVDPLDAPVQQVLHDIISNSYVEKGKEIEIKYEIDPTLIAGLKIRIGDLACDLSLASLLSLNEKSWLEAPPTLTLPKVVPREWNLARKVAGVPLLSANDLNGML